MLNDYLNKVINTVPPEALTRNINIELNKLGHADLMYERIMRLIYEFESKLKPDEEIGAYLTSFGREVIIQIESVGYMNPYLIVFHGKNTLDASSVQLVQHVSQINLMFVALKLVEVRKPYRIGFPSEPEKSDKT